MLFAGVNDARSKTAVKQQQHVTKWLKCDEEIFYGLVTFTKRFHDPVPTLNRNEQVHIFEKNVLKTDSITT